MMVSNHGMSKEIDLRSITQNKGIANPFCVAKSLNNRPFLSWCGFPNRKPNFTSDGTSAKTERLDLNSGKGLEALPPWCSERTMEGQAAGYDILYLGSSDGVFGVLAKLLQEHNLSMHRLDAAEIRVERDRFPSIIIYESAAAQEFRGFDALLSRFGRPALSQGTTALPLLIPIIEDSDLPVEELTPFGRAHDFIQLPLDRTRVAFTVLNAQRLASTLLSNQGMSRRIKVFHNQWHKLNEIGTALTTFHDLDQLLDYILKKCREITSADSGSLYLKEYASDPGSQDAPAPVLRFKVAQNDSKFIPFKEWTMPARKESISGYVALEGQEVMIDDVYELPADSPFRFDTSFDKTSGYRTGSMLVVPMRNHKDEIIGVIQLINKKIDSSDVLKDPEKAKDLIAPFDLNDRQLAVSLASQAAVAVDNARLMEDIRIAMRKLKNTNDELERSNDKIEELFEAFVKTCSKAVESRDNALSGHVERMAIYACSVGEAINRVTEGPLAQYHFNADRMKALKYAAILHDIGKIGVKEEILWKATRLNDDRVEAIRYRSQSIQDQLRESCSSAQMRFILENPGTPHEECARQLESELSVNIKQVDDVLAFVERVNRLGFLMDDDLDELNRIRELRIRIQDREICLITESEYENLAVRKGNLTAREWVEMKKHVAFTYEILSEIPWEGDLRLVPEWAASHHEKRDGMGYYRGLAGDDIPIGGQVLAIVDIYEALTASDRPYKKQFSLDEALGFLRESAETNWLNPHIVELFIEQKLYEIKLPEVAKIPERQVA